jgi:hypothetical protein
MLGHVEVEDPAPMVGEDDRDEEHMEVSGRNVVSPIGADRLTACRPGGVMAKDSVLSSSGGSSFSIWSRLA